MALPIITDAYRCQLFWSAPGGLTATTLMHFLQSGTTAQAMATTLDSHVTATMWNSAPTTAQVDTVHVTPLDGVSATYIFATGVPAKWKGAGAGDIIPAASFLVSCRTAFRGPAKRGRFYLPFLSESSQAAGTILASDVTTGQAAWNAFLAAMIAAGAQPIVASYKHSSQVPITSYVYEPKSATQRRRQSRLR